MHAAAILVADPVRWAGSVEEPTINASCKVQAVTVALAIRMEPVVIKLAAIKVVAC
jgi:hypothetical protein